MTDRENELRNINKRRHELANEVVRLRDQNEKLQSELLEAEGRERFDRKEIARLRRALDIVQDPADRAAIREGVDWAK